MDKILTIIIGASVLLVAVVVLTSSLTGSLRDTTDAKNSLQKNTKCEVQAREAKNADDPSIVESECLDYIEDSEFRAEAESTEVSCILSGNC